MEVLYTAKAGVLAFGDQLIMQVQCLHTATGWEGNIFVGAGLEREQRWFSPHSTRAH